MARLSSNSKFVIPQVIGNKYNQSINQSQVINEIQSFVALEALSVAESRLLTSLYGTGVKIAEARQLKQKISKENSNDFRDANPNANGSLYNPDAIPDGNGGFLTSQNWNGKMSSSLQGMPVMCSLKCIGKTYTALDGSSVTVPDIEFETVIITMSPTKNIEKTTTGGNNGTVKEHIGLGDWNIEIRAIITSLAPVNSDINQIGQDGHYPIENMEAIMIMLLAPISIKVECWFLNKIAKVNYIVFDSGIKIDQVEGEYEMQRLTIQAISDNPFIITLQG